MRIEGNGVSYRKPNMAALEGEWSWKLVDETRSAPRSDFTESDKRGATFNERMHKAKEDGTFERLLQEGTVLLLAIRA